MSAADMTSDDVTPPSEDAASANGSGVCLFRGSEVDPEALTGFLEEALGQPMARFLAEHAQWWHRGADGRFVVTCDGEVAGYRAMVPATWFVEGQEVSGAWLMHLYVAPRFRGRGLQKVLDRPLLSVPHLRLSFPNDLGAVIYAKQGHGIRRDLTISRLPLRPRLLPRLLEGRGARMAMLKAGAHVLSPAAAVMCARVSRYRSALVEAVEFPAPEVLEDLFRRSITPDLVTTLRSAEFLRWRYLEAPYRAELTCYLRGRSGRPTHYAISRHMTHVNTTKVRVLDIFGDLSDAEALEDLLRTVVRDAARQGAAFVEMLTSLPEVRNAARRAGLVLEGRRMFRWSADDPDLRERLETARLYWTLADGENDFIS